ncbi:hemagglutinin repeat-containing protein [uncultured Novosphingobium sp.]|uniref:two-partner secretion domain-containing protein n=1 Tax=uncultured Novosphingobium sp. TaxID=292277 RepID=UPI00374A2A08
MARFRKTNLAFKRKLARFLLVTTSLCVPALAAAQVVAGDAATQVYTAPNGVTVVDIARANADGLSHNRFEQYSVPTNGVVLNNGNRDVLNRQSQLAGSVTANFNLDKEARVILNEVTGANRSILAGYTEVVGSTADVFVANPYGITCNGCGFINAPNVTLTTGRPNIDGNGHLGGFSVTGGDILITGKGLNATAQDYLALVARSVKIDGQINAKTMDVVTGANDWNSDELVVTAKRATDAAPEYAIDSTVLGGMYANRIRLIATEAGVGVRALGDVAASGSDFTLDAAGRVVLAGKISAANDVRVNTSGAGITLQQASLTATRDVALASGAGTAALQGGALVAGRDLSIKAAALTDDAVATTVADQNRRLATGALTIDTSGAATIGAVSYGAKTASLTSGGDLAANGATLYSGSTLALGSGGAMALNASSVRAASGLTVTVKGVLSTTAGANQGLVADTGAVTINAGGLNNGGTISADAGDVSLTSSAAVTNSGTIHAAQGLTIGGATGRVDLRNDGSVLAGGTATITAATLTNNGLVQSAIGGAVTADALTNAKTVTLGSASGDGTITAATVTNAAGATVQSAGALSVNGLTALDNSGVMLAGSALSLNGSGTLSNRQAGTLQAGTTLTASGDTLDNAGLATAKGAATVTVGTLTNSGSVLSASDISATAATLTNTGKLVADGKAIVNAGSAVNSGTIQSVTDLAGNIGTKLDNTGQVIAGGALNLKASGPTSYELVNGTGAFLQSKGALSASGLSALTNSGTLASGTTLDIGVASFTNTTGAKVQGTGVTTLKVAGALSNEGQLIAGFDSTASGSVFAGSVSNSGTLQSGGGLALAVAEKLNNTGKLLAGGALSVTAADGAKVLAISNADNAYIQGAGALTIGGTTGGRNVTLTSQQGYVIADSATLTTGAISNDGVIQTTNALTIDSNALVSNNGTILGQTALTLGADKLANSAAGTVQGSTGAKVTVRELDNKGALIGSLGTGGKLDVSAMAAANSGTIQSGGAADLLVRDTLDNSGKLIGVQSLSIQARKAGTALTLSNASNATIQSSGTLTIGDSTRNVKLGSQDGTILAKTVSATLAGNVTSSGWVQADDTLSFDTTGKLTNTGTIYAKNTLTLASSALSNKTGAQIQGSRGGTLTSSGDINNDGTITLGLDANSGTINARSLSNKGTLQSIKDLMLITSGGDVDNSGTLYAGGRIIVKGAAPTDGLQVRNRLNAVFQAGDTITIGEKGGKTSLTNEGGSLIADTLTMYGDKVNNSGAIQTTRDGRFTLSDTFDNSGTVLVQGQLKLAASSFENEAKGQIEAVTGSELTATSFTNDGALYLASQANRDATVSADKFTNSGTIVGNGNVTLAIGGTLSNTKDIAAAGDLRIKRNGTGTLSITNASGATMQADGTLSIKNDGSALVQFGTQAGTLWGGRSLDLSMASLVNAGTLRSDADANLTFSGTFTNQTGKVLLATSGKGTGTITANSIVNGNILQSQSNLKLNVGTGGLQNDKTILASNDLTIAGTSNYAITGTAGRYQSGGTLVISGGTAALTLGLNSIVYGKTINLDLRSLTLDGDTSGDPIGGAVVSEGDMTLKTGSLAMNAVNVAIMGNVRAQGDAINTGKTSITVAGSIFNPGFIFSGAQLALTGTSILNSGGGGINSLGNASLTTTAGHFDNFGDIYSAKDLSVSVGAYNITNSNAIRTDGSMTFTAAKFTNLSDIAAKGDITVDAAIFENTIGNDPRNFAGAEGQKNMPETSKNYYTLNEGDSPGDVPVDGRRGATNEGDTRYYHEGTYTTEDTFNVPRSSIVRPKMVADGTLSIVNFQTATNFGGSLSGNTFKLDGAGSTSTFTNDAVAIYKSTRTVKYQDFDDCDGAVGRNCILHGKLGYSDTVTKQEYVDSIGASIYAVNLDVKAFKVINIASVLSADSGAARGTTGSATDATGATGNAASLSGLKTVLGGTLTGGTNGIGSVGGATGAVSIVGADLRDLAAVQLAVATNGIGGATTVQGLAAVAYQGVVITLPTSINGQFVTSRDPSASYLVETNPRFGLDGAVGSDFMAQRLGVNPDLLVRRLGDAAYEAYLISQQVAAQVGTAKLVQAETSDEQVARLMMNGVDAATALGLTYGKALTPEQQAKLGTDMVWMVETEVAGQKVLAPVVYLSAKTKAMFESGTATIHATDTANFNVGTLTNTGGSIVGEKALNVDATGDVRNTSGTMSGGNVSVRSTGGSIINETYASTTGTDGNKATVIGKTAGITATNGLALDAAKDITVSGAIVSAGTDASLKAGNNITFGTVDDVNSTSQRGKDSYSTKTTTDQLGSTLSVGGNLSMQSGGDTTFKASDANVKGNADVKTGGDFNIIAGQNSTQTHDENQTSGVGVGGGVYGTSKTTTDEFHGRNVSSNFNVGGNANIDSKGDLTVQGSNVNIGGDANVKASSVNILQGNDVDTSSSKTETTTYLKTSADTKSGAGTSKDAKASAGGYSAQASAEVGAKAKNENSGNLELMNHTTATTDKESSRAVGSTFNVGGNANVKADKDVTLQGSEMNVGGNVAVDAQNINLLAAENKETSTTTTDTHSVGFMVDNENKAEAKAGASASASFTAQAQAEAKGEAESDTNIDLYRNTQETATSKDITHTGSTIKSGGNTSLTASNQMTVEGSSVDAGGDLNLKAKDMTFKEVNDVHETTTTKQQTGAGLYVNGNAEAKAGAEAGMTGASAGASAGAEGSAGLQVSHTSSSNTEGSTTAVTSSLKSGGNMTRTAENGITDAGTDVEAGGNFSQTAKTWDSKAAADTTYSSSSAQSDKGRIGAYADAEAGATAGASVTGKGTGADADASVGVKASYEHEDSNSTANSSTARTSTIKSGGSFSSTTTDKTSLEGTNIQSGGDASLTAGSLDYTAARDTSSSTSNSNKGTAEVKAGISATKAVKAEASGGYEGSQEQAESSKAVTGGITSGGNLNIKTTKGDANLEGTNLNAAGDGSIDSAGSVNFTAARDTASSSKTTENASLGVSLSKGGGGGTSGGVEVGGGFTHEDASSDTAKVGSFTTGGNQSIKAKNDATIEGTTIKSGGDASIDAGGDLKMKAAESTNTSHSYGAQLSLSGEASKKDEGTKKPDAAKPGAANDGKWQSAKPNKGDGDTGGAKPTTSNGGDGGTSNPKPTPSSSGDGGSGKGSTTDGGEKPKPVIGTRGNSNDGGSTSGEGGKPTKTDTSNPKQSEGSKGDTPEKPKPVIGTRGNSNDGGTPAKSDTSNSKHSEGVKSTVPDKPKVPGAPVKQTESSTDGAQKPSDKAGGTKSDGGWVSARPSALGPEAPKPEEKKPEGIEKGGSVQGSATYQSTTTTNYTGSDVQTGGALTVNAGGNVNQENVKTTTGGGSTTTAGGTITTGERKDTTTTTAGGASLGVKTTSANTSTGTADNAGQTTP